MSSIAENAPNWPLQPICRGERLNSALGLFRLKMCPSNLQTVPNSVVFMLDVSEPVI